jgi:IS5 family transposase
MIKRRSAIEPTIGHMKTDGRLGRNPLKRALGDALHAVLCGAGHNIRLLLKKLRPLSTFIVWAIKGDRAMNQGAHQLAAG